jgi:DNA-binding CsgD family transcriptional regulator
LLKRCQTQGNDFTLNYDEEETMRKDSIELTGVTLTFTNIAQVFGIAMLMVTNDLILREPAVLLYDLTTDNSSFSEIRIVLNLAFIITLFVVGLLSLATKREPLPLRLFIAYATTAAATLSLVFAIKVMLNPPEGLVFAFFILQGVFASLGLFCWISVLKSLPLRIAWIEIVIALAVSALGYLFFLYAAQAVSVVLLFTFTWLAALGSAGWFMRKSDSTEEKVQTVFRQHGFVDTVRENYASILCITALNFVLTASRTAFPYDSSALVNTICASGILLASVFLVLTYLSDNRSVGITLVYQVSFPIIAIMFLLIPFMSEELRGLFMLAATAFGTMGSTTLFLIALSSRASSDSPAAAMYGIFSGFMHVFLFIGLLSNLSAIPDAGEGLARYMVIAVIFAYALMALLMLSRKKLDEHRMQGGIVFVGSEANFNSRINSIALEHGLTQRESEIMKLLMFGKGVEAIADELGISANTVRTHNKNLYRKLNAHTKAELLNLLSL